MIKKTIEYENFDGEKVKESFYFNLTPVEIAELNEEIPGGIEHFKDILNDNPAVIDVMKLFKKLINKSVAKKSGANIVKPDGLADQFTASDAYSNLFFELWQDSAKMTEFFNGIIPASARERMISGDIVPAEPSAEVTADA